MNEYLPLDSITLILLWQIMTRKNPADAAAAAGLVVEDFGENCVANIAAVIVAFKEGGGKPADELLLSKAGDGSPADEFLLCFLWGDAAGAGSSLLIQNAMTSPLFVPKKHKSIKPPPLPKS